MTAERIGENKHELRPSKELITEDGYRWFVFDERQVPLKMVCLEDVAQGVVITASLANPDHRTAAYKAWAGARQSRAPGYPWDIVRQMGQKGVDPDQKLEETFRGYGHASVGDMASIHLDFSGVPIPVEEVLFLLSRINSGQAKSTRYQPSFERAEVVPMDLPDALPIEAGQEMERLYKETALQAAENFRLAKAQITGAFEKFYGTPTDSAERSAMQSRVLDTARYLLLWGVPTGISFETSARDWARMIGALKASPISQHQKLGSHIERFLTPTPEEESLLGFKAEAPSLIRHTEASIHPKQNLVELRQFLATTDFFEAVTINRTFKGYVQEQVELIDSSFSPAERMAAQYILTLYPGANRSQVLSWVHQQSEDRKQSLGAIIFNGHTHQRELSEMAATTSMSVVIEANLAEQRDLLRHRAFGRFLNMPIIHGEPINFDTAAQILSAGYGMPAYLLESEFATEFAMMDVFLREHYTNLVRLLGFAYQHLGDNGDYSFILNVLPLGHHVDLIMHGDPKQFLYMPHLRVRDGGQINYRLLAYEVSNLVADSDPLLDALRIQKKPDSRSKEEFYSRS